MAKNLVISRFLDRLNPELAESFNSEQLAAVEMHFGMRYQIGHVIDWRGRFRFPFANFYLVILAGRDRRQPNP